MVVETGAKMTTEVQLGEIDPGVVCIFGEPGTLKTSYALSWPKPLKLYDFDLGAHRGWEIKKMVANGDVVVERMEMPVKSLTTRHQKLVGFMAAWQEFLVDFTQCLESDIKTIVFDTSTMKWSLVRDAYLEELQQKPAKDGSIRRQLLQIEHGPPNSRMRGVLDAAKSAGKWIILVMHETDEYAPLVLNGVPILDNDGNPKSAQTGKKIPDGFKYTRGLSDWVFRTAVDLLPDGKPRPFAKMEKSAMGIDLVGLDYDWFQFDKLVNQLDTMGRL